MALKNASLEEKALAMPAFDGRPMMVLTDGKLMLRPVMNDESKTEVDGNDHVFVCSADAYQCSSRAIFTISIISDG
jgi:hypothetical protein